MATCIVVLTSSDLEFDAVCRHIPGAASVPLLGPGQTQMGYGCKIGEFAERQIIAICSHNTGPSEMQTALHAALMQYSAELILVVGICGSLQSDKVKLGSVVISESIKDLTYSQETSEGTKFRVGGGSIDPDVVEVCTLVVNEALWPNRIIAPPIECVEQLNRTLFLGEIVSTVILLKNTETERFHALKEAAPDALIVEMESAGCYALSQKLRRKFVTIRGVSDHVYDKLDETDTYRQPWAAAHAAAVAFELIETYLESRLAKIKSILSDSPESGPSKFGVILSSDTPICKLNQVPRTLKPCRREHLVARLIGHMEKKQVPWLHGSTGLGKTTLTQLVADQIGGEWIFADLRKCTAIKVTTRLSKAHSTLAEGSFNGLILDDYPADTLRHTKMPLQQLAAQVREAGLHLIVTSDREPTLALQDAFSDIRAVPIPYFTDSEISQLIVAAGGEPGIWTLPVRITTADGHPQLVVARLSALQKKGWPTSELLATPPEIDRRREDTAFGLTRELSVDDQLYLSRLSLCEGIFDRNIAQELANWQPVIERPLDRLRSLTGPWIEQRTSEFFVLSPLISDLGKRTLPQLEQSSGRRLVIGNLISRNPFPREFLSRVFLLSFIEESDEGWLWFGGVLLQYLLRDRDEFRKIAQEVVIFGFFRTDTPLLPGNLKLSSLLRIAQFFVAFENRLSTITTVFEAALRESQQIADKEISSGAQLLLLARLLVQGSGIVEPRLWLPAIADFDAIYNGAPELAKQLENTANEAETPIRLEQVLFAIEASAGRTIEGLEQIFCVLNTLSPDKRANLLEPADQEFKVKRKMVDLTVRTSSERVDARQLAARYGALSDIARSWGDQILEIECIRAQAGVTNDYAKQTDEALQIIDESLERLGPHARLFDAKQLILFQKRDYEGAISAFDSLQAIGGLDEEDLQFVAIRSAAMSAAALGHWSRARTLFDQTIQLCRSSDSSFHRLIPLLLADCSIVAFDAKDYTDSIAMALQALEEYERICPEDEACLQLLLQFAAALEVATSTAPLGAFAFYPGYFSNPNAVASNLSVNSVNTAWYFVAIAATQLNDGDLAIKELRDRMGETASAADELDLQCSLIRTSCRTLNRSAFLAALPLYLQMCELASSSNLTLEEYAKKVVILSAVHPKNWNSSNISNALAEAALLFCFFAVIMDRSEEIMLLHEQLRQMLPVTEQTVLFLNLLNKPYTGFDDASSIELNASIVALLRDHPKGRSPTDLHLLTVYLLRWLTSSRLVHYFASRFAEHVSALWIRTLRESRFALSNPNQTVPELEKTLSGATSGIARLAALSLAALGATSLSLTTNDQEQLRILAATELDR